VASDRQRYAVAPEAIPPHNFPAIPDSHVLDTDSIAQAMRELFPERDFLLDLDPEGQSRVVRRAQELKNMAQGKGGR